MNVYTVIVTAMSMMLLAPTASLKAQHRGGDQTAIGFRLGWSGGPNGLTYRKVTSQCNAFEFVAGYNGKFGRHADMPQYKKGNSFVGASYSPFLQGGNGDLSVSVTGSLGARLNYHHYRPLRFNERGWKITPDVMAGVGLQLETHSVEIFADMHIKYYNSPYNAYIPGMESGLGMRVIL